MFTGLIKYLSTMVLDGNIMHLYAEPDFLKKISLGDSIAIDGTCLTVSSITETHCSFFLTEETLSKTNFNKKVNVELSLQYGDYMGGHIVTGHIHQSGTVISLQQNGDIWLDLGCDANLVTSYKGSIAVNGVSLTIAEILESKIRIALIPETLARTNLSLLQPGDLVNLEFDLKPENAQTYDDYYYMRLAIQEGEKGRVSAPPNPWVGCVIVKNHKIIAKGYHRKAGEPHAEVNAINSASQEVAGSTVYVTLEPCCHYGRTPPCTNLLIAKGISKVVIGVADPDKKVNGSGINQLRDAGIEVVLMEYIDKKIYDEVKYSLRQYLHHRKTDRPYITAKIALSVDNCYRNAEGSSKWITNVASRKEAHKLRAENQAIMVGALTAQQDDPELTVRYDIAIDKQPTRIVIDGMSLTAVHNKIFASASNTIIMTSEALANKWPAHLSKKIVPVIDSKLDLEAVVNNIDAISCLIEGGGKLQKCFLQQGLVNEIVIFKSSKIFGKNGYQWSIPKNIKLDLVESKIIADQSDNNIMERYLVSSNNVTEEEESECVFDDIDYAIKQFKQGSFVLVMDDESRENEGDLIVAAATMTEEQMTEMINHTTGIICVPIEKSRAKKLNLPPMCAINTDNKQTAFTVSVDSIDTGTGVSSKDRLKTIKTLANEETVPLDLRRPGHIFPLVAHPEGLKFRQGHTEAAIALCALADIYPRVAVIGELQNKDGSMKRRQDCYMYAKANNIPMIHIQQLIALNVMPLLAECQIQTKIGSQGWAVQCYGNTAKPHKVFIYPKTGVSTDSVVAVRMHSECFTGDTFKSLQCDCGDQLESAMHYIVNKGQGIIMFPADHEGRGIGIVHKIKAYKLQKDTGVGTFQANKMLGFDIDARSFDDMKNILKSMGICKIELLTDNPTKIQELGDLIITTTPLKIAQNAHNQVYLDDKHEYFKTLGASVESLDSMKAVGTAEALVKSGTAEALVKSGTAEALVKSGTAEALVKSSSPVINLSGVNVESFKVAIVHAMWHDEYIEQIRNILRGHLNKLGLFNISEYSVPGSNEIPFKASKIAPNYDGIICVGILIKGDTLHFENVSTAVSNGIMQAQINTGIPMMNCVLSCLNMEQAVDRITGDKSTLEYIARSLIKMMID